MAASRYKEFIPNKKLTFLPLFFKVTLFIIIFGKMLHAEKVIAGKRSNPGLRIICILCICLSIAYSVQSLTITRTWSLSGERTEKFELVDTCSLTVSFPDLVPPTYLYGYDRFGVTISDSINNAGMEAIPVLNFSFDAGFLYFDHILTVTIPFSSTLIFDSLRQPGQYRLYRDPFPYTGFHQWYEDDSITIDSSKSLLSFVYHHPKYIPLRKSNGYASVKIASTGYPFDFGIFFHPSIGTYRLWNSPSSGTGFNCRLTDNGLMIYGNSGNGNRTNLPYRVVVFNSQGRKIGQWNLSDIPALLPLAHHASPGMYLATLYQERRLVDVFTGVIH